MRKLDFVNLSDERLLFSAECANKLSYSFIPHDVARLVKLSDWGHGAASAGGVRQSHMTSASCSSKLFLHSYLERFTPVLEPVPRWPPYGFAVKLPDGVSMKRKVRDKPVSV